jgi:hypothetical protein
LTRALQIAEPKLTPPQNRIYDEWFPRAALLPLGLPASHVTIEPEADIGWESKVDPDLDLTLILAGYTLAD